MEHIINMEYSLRAILYLIQMQVEESKQSWHYYYTEEYPFLDIPTFKAEVSDYLIQYGSDRLKFFLKECYRLCFLILHESESLSKIPLADNTGVYCTFEKKETPSFYDAGLYNIDLIKHSRSDAKRMEIWNIIDAIKTIARFLAEVGFSDIKPNTPSIINNLTNSVTAAAQVIINEAKIPDAVPVSDVIGQKPQPENQNPPKADDKIRSQRLSKTFSQFLIYENKDDLMKKLHKLLDFNPSGRDVAMILECLVDCEYTSKPARLVNSAITEFNLACSNQSINAYYLKGFFSVEEKQPIIKLFN